MATNAYEAQVESEHVAAQTVFTDPEMASFVSSIGITRDMMGNRPALPVRFGDSAFYGRRVVFIALALQLHPLDNVLFLFQSLNAGGRLGLGTGD